MSDIRCPRCGRKLAEVDDVRTVAALGLKCPRCKVPFVFDWHNGNLIARACEATRTDVPYGNRKSRKSARRKG